MAISARISRNKQYREFMRSKNSKRKVPKTKLRYPKLIEMDYFKSIKALNKRLVTAVEEILIPAIPMIWSNYQSELRLDGYNDQIKSTLEDIEFKMNDVYSTNNVESITIKYATETNRANRMGINRQTMELLGLNMFAAEPWLEAVTDAWIGENVALIKSIPTQYLHNVEYMIKKGLAEGLSYEKIQRGILDTVQFVDRERTIKSATGFRVVNPDKRARLIARDQVGKYFGQLTKFRHLDLGVTHFVWDAVMDERTRASHRELNGKVYSWAKGANGLYPGQEIQCRCTSSPVFN